MLRSLLRATLNRLPYIGTLRTALRAQGCYPAGHFYSPIPTETEVRTRFVARPPDCDPLPGINLNSERQRTLLDAFGELYRDLPFPERRTAGIRYYFDQTMFCYADAIFLYCFLRHFQPKQIIEVGAGFSSAVMLDTVDRFFEARPELTFVEPDPVNLKQLLRPSDWRQATLLERLVQAVPVEFFTSRLRPGDFLFIDSSHVVKCGSDVQYLLLDVLPRLPVGVHVHFHDVCRGFEYPREWLLDGWYWNEAYALRAFLTSNQAWEISLFGNYAVQTFGDWFAEHMPLCLKNPGGSLYLQRTA